MFRPRTEVTYEQIGNLVREYAYETFGEKFKFRDGNPSQFDICVDIIYRFVSNEFKSEKRKYILQAPTGSGKSVIAIVVAGVLSKMYNMHGYILVSDISLLEQYVTAVNEFCPEWGTIKGRSRYDCILNGRKFDHGICRMKSSSFDVVGSCKHNCKFADVCPYVSANIHAMHAKVVVCTYYWWLIYKNRVACYDNEAWKNEFVICDECHNICDIVQDMYSLNVGKEYADHFGAVEELFPETKAAGRMFRSSVLVSSIISDCNDAELFNEENDTIKDMRSVSGKLTELSNMVKDTLMALRTEVAKSSNIQNESLFYKEIGWFNNTYERLNMYIEGIKGRTDCIIATVSDDGRRVTFNSTDEKELINKRFNSNYECGLYMSATIGGSGTFADSMGFLEKNADSDYREIGYAEIESPFDFTYSPIFFCGEYNMKRRNREENAPKIAEMIDGILDKWPNNRGCIFVSSYSMAEDFYRMLSVKNKSRVLTYRSAKEKDTALAMFKNTPNAVIIGPTLFEGISFDDDLCRFSIVAKVPYADTSNKLVSWKLKKYGFRDYATSAIRSTIQAVGRGIRHKNDWCNTYILDGGFREIYMDTGRFPYDFVKRIVPVTSQQLIE